MPTLNPGSFDRRITLQTLAVGKSDLHERTTSAQDVATVWARWEDLRGRELFAQGQEQLVYEARCVIRWRSDVQADWRVVYRGVVYDIVGQPIERGRREFLELMLVSNARARASA